MENIKRALNEKKILEFDVTEPRKAFAGHTVYRLQLRIFEKSNTESAVVEFLGWKRFNDFKKLHKQLKTAFPATFRQGFNDFVKGNFFGRFDESVIEERRQASIKLLMFILLYPEMLSHKEFVNFIEPLESHSSPHNSNSSRDPTSSFSSVEDVCDEAATNAVSGVSGTDHHSILEARCGDDGDQRNSGDVTDGLNNVTMEEEVEEAESDENEDEVFINVDNEYDGRQTWLREARSLCGDDLEGLASEAEEDFPITPRLDSVEDTSVLFGDPLGGGEEILCSTPEKSDSNEDSLKRESEEGRKQHDEEPIHSEDSIDGQSGVITSGSEINGNITPDSSTDILGSTTAITRELQEQFRVDAKMSEIISRTVEEDDYVFQASVAMSNAIEQEGLGNVDGAFNMYKFGIGLLLRGVQTDTNVERREAVRRKTAQYLLRAEELYQSTLLQKKKGMLGEESGSTTATTRPQQQQQQQQPSNTLSSTPFSAASGVSLDNKWRFRLSDVKVIGITDQVMLVQKIFCSGTTVDDVFVMKVLHKQGAEYKKRSTPQQQVKNTKKSPRNLYNCQFMARLVNCVETKTGIYLLLEHVVGGKLWDYLGLPIFFHVNGSKSSLHSNNDVYHSWDASDCNSSFVGETAHAHNNNDNNDVDIVDIPARSYVTQGSNDLSRSSRTSSSSSSVIYKVKRSPSKSAAVNEENIKLWAAQIALALMDLHTKGVICRDLNPRNILIDAQGDIKLTYFSCVDGIDYSLDDNAVQFLYSSPEADGVFEATSATDWWSYGAILFELLTAEALHSCHPDGINRRSIITLPRRVSNEACALLAGLLKYNPKERLGSGPTGNEEIKAHPFFHGIDWESFKK